MIVFIVLLIGCAVCIVVGVVQGIVQYVTVPKPPKGLSYKQIHTYYSCKAWEVDEADEFEEIHRQERIDLADETILKYNRLLDSLTEQLKYEHDEKKRSAILAKQIVTLEKLQRALEKREKLDS